MSAGQSVQHVLGVSMSNHDRSACLLRDGEVRGAVAEERLDRRKYSEGFYRHSPRGIVLPPMRAIARLLADEGIGIDDVDLVVCGRSISRCRDAFLAAFPVDPSRVVEPPVPGHHLAHGYSAYATAPFDEAAVLVIDEQGEWTGDSFEKCTWLEGRGGSLRAVQAFRGSRLSLSLGMLYNVFATFSGLSEAGRPAAGKLMSLAALGAPPPDWPVLVDPREDGDVDVSLAVVEECLCAAGLPFRPGMRDFEVREVDDLLAKYRPVPWRSALAAKMAAKAQDELERAVLHIAAVLRAVTAQKYLAYAGGVALNCVANSRLREAGWDDVYVHPAATDDGAAVGLAFYGWVEVMGERRPAPRRFVPLTGPVHSAASIDRALSSYGLGQHACSSTPIATIAERVARGSLLCWYQGRSEWGPRALGARSIVANPALPGITRRINSCVKFREPFRPFGISCTAEAQPQLLDDGGAAPSLKAYMLAVGRVVDERLRPVAHTDGSLRYQVVFSEDQPRWHELITAVGDITGVPAVLNTSFNTFGEPLVESPEDAVRQFLLSGCDLLLIEDTLVDRARIPPDELAAAWDKAWTETPMDELRTALALEAAGHAGEAAALVARLVETGRTPSRGLPALRSLHALQARLAASGGDPAGAAAHAETVLRWAGLPDEARAVAELLVGFHAEGESAKQAAAMMAQLAEPGKLWSFLRSVLDRKDDDAQGVTGVLAAGRGDRAD